ncbi:TPA: tol-pal system-associated acyl-CoA thioesterase [Salmonella enterica]
MGNNLMQTDLSVWGMYQHADIVVKCVMIGLILASVVTWAIFFSKSVEFFTQKRRLKREQLQLADARSLDQASDIAAGFSAKSLSAQLINEAQNELELSQGSEDNEGIKERTGFRLERRVAAVGRYMGRGNGYLATIGAISPFVGLFGTVWGIMNSFIGIAQTQTTNLAVVAPGIAEALLATAIGLVAAIPAVVIYNIFARQIGSYKAPLATVDVKVNLPASTSTPQPRPEKPVYLSVKADNTMFIGNDPVTDDTMIAELTALTEGKKDTTIFFRADKTVEYETLMKVMDMLHQAGYLKIGLVGEETAKAK